MTSGSNWRHLNSPEIDWVRSIGPAYRVKPPNLQHFPAWCTLAGYEAIHMIRKGHPYGSAAGAKVGLLHRFILDLFAATN
jgi:hypothetical protein